MGIFQEELFKFVIHHIHNNQIKIEVESIVILLFSISKIESMIGHHQTTKLFDGN